MRPRRFSVIQNGRRKPFCEKKSETKLRIHLKWREMRSKVIFGLSKWPAYKPFWDIHSICPWANTPILVVCEI